MGRCYSVDHINRKHGHNSTCRPNIEEPQQKHRPGMDSNRFLSESGGTGLKLILLDPNPRPSPSVFL